MPAASKHHRRIIEVFPRLGDLEIKRSESGR